MSVTVRSPSNTTKVIEKTELLLKIPNSWGLFAQLNIFEKEFLTQKTVMIPRITQVDYVVVDKNWGERGSNIQKGTKSYMTFQVPHFPLDDSILAKDLDGNIKWEEILGSETLETVASIQMRKLEAIRKAHALTLENARIQLINDGTVYAPSGTLTQSYGPTINWYTELGVSRTELEMSLNDPTINPQAEIEQIWANVQDNAKNGEIPGTLVAICSAGFFEKLRTNPYIVDVVKYQQYDQSQKILLGRLTADQYKLDARYRTLYFGDILWISYRGTGMTKQIDANEARIFPIDVDGMFKTYYAPAETFQSINKTAQEAYFAQKVDDWDTEIEIRSESNFINVLRNPESLIRVSIAA
jgi:hypothetical protein